MKRQTAAAVMRHSAVARRRPRQAMPPASRQTPCETWDSHSTRLRGISARLRALSMSWGQMNAAASSAASLRSSASLETLRTTLGALSATARDK